MNDLEQWEADAEQFYKDTGYMRPGKDDARGYHTAGERREAFDIWCKCQRRVAELEKQKNGAYSERNRLVSALSKVFPSSIERHPDDDLEWENDWRWIVFIDLPTGQATWHIHDSEIPLFKHLEIKGRKWDGHTNDEKYARLNALAHPRGGGENT